MTESDNSGESQQETPNATPTRRSDGQPLEGASESEPTGSLSPDIVIHVEDGGGLRGTGEDQPQLITLRTDPPAGP